MKTFSLVLNVVLLASTIFLAVKLNQKTDEGLAEDAARWRAIRQGAEAYRQKTEAPYESLTRDSTIPFSDPELARRYIDNFTDDLSNLTRYCGAGAYPTTSMWIDKEAVYRITEYMQNSHDSADGVSVYFAQYGVQNQDGDRQRWSRADSGRYDNQYTGVLVVTRNDKGYHIPFLRKVPGKYSAADVYEGLYNYHDLCPPNTNCIPPDYFSKYVDTLR
jgi:hypothetical protein